jgi:hypothetical protein
MGNCLRRLSGSVCRAIPSSKVMLPFKVTALSYQVHILSNKSIDNHTDKGLLEALVADLDPQQKYTFRVKALTKSTEGAWTDEISVTTSSRLLPDEPRSSSTKGNFRQKKDEGLIKSTEFTLYVDLLYILNSPGLCTPFLFSIFIFLSLGVLSFSLYIHVCKLDLNLFQH